jgi:hypothetical protein
LNFPDPLLQLGFATLLEGARERLLLGALRQTIAGLPTTEIDQQLSYYASAGALASLSGHGMRGETVFPVPLVLARNPSLLGYYRLLFGYSQKQFYTTRTGASCLRTMETKGMLTSRAAANLEDACRAFARAGEMLIGGLGSKLARPDFPHELSLLTLGAQFRGAANNTRGTDGIKAVVAILERVFADEIERIGERLISIRTPGGKLVEVQIASDPDILITSVMSEGQRRLILAIEVKAGEDHSNIWNRVGEAEKSHLKARDDGINERWTIINDPQAAEGKLKSSSPSTTRFYQLLHLIDDQSGGFADFRSRIRDMAGL